MDTNVCEEHAAYIFRVKFNMVRARLIYTGCKWIVLKTFRSCGAVEVGEIWDKEWVVANVSCIPKSASVHLRGHLKRAPIYETPVATKMIWK